MAASLFKWFTGPILCAVSALPLLGASGPVTAPAASACAPHPLYITVTEINHNPKDRILEVSCKMFTNDFESVLEKASGARVDLSATRDTSATNKLIGTYVERHLRLRVDGKAAALQFVGSEKEEDGTWSYFQVNDVAAVKRIDVTNDLLYDGFPQEINIMHVTVGGHRQSTRLDCPAATATFQF